MIKSTSVENSSSMTIFFLRSSQTQTLFPGYLVRTLVLWSQRFLGFGAKPGVLAGADHGEVVATEEHLKISKTPSSWVTPVLCLEPLPLVVVVVAIVVVFIQISQIRVWNLRLFFSEGIWVVNAKTTFSPNTETALEWRRMTGIAHVKRYKKGDHAKY